MVPPPPCNQSPMHRALPHEPPPPDQSLPRLLPPTAPPPTAPTLHPASLLAPRNHLPFAPQPSRISRRHPTHRRSRLPPCPRNQSPLCTTALYFSGRRRLTHSLPPPPSPPRATTTLSTTALPHQPPPPDPIVALASLPAPRNQSPLNTTALAHQPPPPDPSPLPPPSSLAQPKPSLHHSSGQGTRRNDAYGWCCFTTTTTTTIPPITIPTTCLPPNTLPSCVLLSSPLWLRPVSPYNTVGNNQTP